MNKVQLYKKNLAELKTVKERLEQIAEKFRQAGSFPQFYSDEYTGKIKDLTRSINEFEARLSRMGDEITAMEDPERLALLGEVTTFMGYDFDYSLSKERLQHMKILIGDGAITDDEKRFLIGLACPDPTKPTGQ